MTTTTHHLRQKLKEALLSAKAWKALAQRHALEIIELRDEILELKCRSTNCSTTASKLPPVSPSSPV